jgi:Xaa-Pro dipeptidase
MAAQRAVFEKRARRIFAQARKVKGGKNVDALVFANGSMPMADYTFFYLTGFERGVFERSGVVVFPSGRMKIFTIPLEEESAQSRKSELFVFQKWTELEDWMKRQLKGVRALGINGAELNYRWAQDLKKWAKAPLVDVSRAVQNARVTKDAEEIGRLRRAAAIASDAAAQIPDILRTGITEQEAAAELEHQMALRGSSSPSFTTICAFGANSSQPHYSPDKVKLRPGMYALFDFGATSKRYCSDITRTFVYGKASPKHKEVYDIVLKSNQAGIDLMVDGTAAREVHETCARIIDETKYRGRFIHSTGHSLGLAVHDGAGLGVTSDFVLKEGMVFTCEPGIYVPGFGGVRIEDDVVIGKRKATVLTYADKELLEVRAR